MFRELHDVTVADRQAHERLNGRYNDFPPGWREIDAAEFAKSRHFMFCPVLVEFRQMMRPFGETDTTKDVPHVSAYLYWQQNGTGYAVVNDYWAGTVKFYTFGSVPAGYVETFDSSD